MSSEQPRRRPERNIRLAGIEGVVWVDDDGTKFRRTFENGEAVDRRIRND